MRSPTVVLQEVAQGAPEGADPFFYCTLAGLDFAGAVARVIEALKAEGFGVQTDLDVQQNLSAALNAQAPCADMPGAGKAPPIFQALRARHNGGMLRPCNVVVLDEHDNTQTVGFIDPVAALSLVDAPEVAELAFAARNRLERVRSALVDWPGSRAHCGAASPAS